MDVIFHIGKANEVADALSKLYIDSLTHVRDEKKELAKDTYRLDRLGVLLMDISNGGVIVQNGLGSSLLAEVKDKQVIYQTLIL